MAHHSVADDASRVVEIDVYPTGTGFGQALPEVRRLVIDCRVESEGVQAKLLLCLAASDAHRAAAMDPCNLADARTHCSGGRRDHNGFSRTRLSDLEQAIVRRHPV